LKLEIANGGPRAREERGHGEGEGGSVGGGVKVKKILFNP